jgi:hypothetical protein
VKKNGSLLFFCPRAQTSWLIIRSCVARLPRENAATIIKLHKGDISSPFIHPSPTFLFFAFHDRALYTTARKSASCTALLLRKSRSLSHSALGWCYLTGRKVRIYGQNDLRINAFQHCRLVSLLISSTLSMPSMGLPSLNSLHSLQVPWNAIRHEAAYRDAK